MSTIHIETINFINHCKFEKNLGAKTIKSYTTDLTQFAEFLEKNNNPQDTDMITKIEIKGFLESISKLKPKSIK